MLDPPIRPASTEANAKPKIPPLRVNGLHSLASLFFRYRRSAANMQLGVTLVLLSGGMALFSGIANGQDREACLDCSAGLERRAVGRDREQAGETQASLSDGSDTWTLRRRVDEVTVFFTTTEGHRFVQGLDKGNIRVRNDNKQVTRISAFGYQRDLPFRLGLVVDTSASVNPQFRSQQEAAHLVTAISPR